MRPLQQAYNRDETDEFVCPTVISQDGKPTVTINDNDAIFFLICAATGRAS